VKILIFRIGRDAVHFIKFARLTAALAEGREEFKCIAPQDMHSVVLPISEIALLQITDLRLVVSRFLPTIYRLLGVADEEIVWFGVARMRFVVAQDQEIILALRRTFIRQSRFFSMMGVWNRRFSTLRSSSTITECGVFIQPFANGINSGIGNQVNGPQGRSKRNPCT
jgi:hypothetical protein